ncbi:hypothetical protein CA54_39890 [Symmachiella macrocystis]|uniref:DUF1549 domain-containing protein n=1 Tax=Symmachiella macrocystis TaxID=2527985 RepID=A0A5C6BAS0_9PLAN|nr:DUF1549 domain-containing protein [Symmachiella macrocystis]TWU08752.1 hypothetical protein CA54_39890 [Symmachiella macrocystis]
MHTPRHVQLAVICACSVLMSTLFLAPTLGDEEANPVAPRRPDLPSIEKGSALTNPIDRFLQTTYAAENIDVERLVSDEVFARRVHEDLVGLLPSPAELQAFVADSHPDKRQRLVRKLLADRRAYAEHWLTFWNDALRNAFRGTGFIDDGRRQITGWLFAALYDNKPYDQFVHELISPVDGSAGFIKGIIWRGTVNASQRREMQAAQTISQVFLGTNIKCASCHDSFIDTWTLDDAYGLANVFADEPLETFECNKPNGEFATVKFLFPQLGKIDSTAPRDERIQQLADIMTSPQNGRLSRTIVNRLWAILMGRGLVEPVDEMDLPPWHADLLDWLAVDLAEHDYNLQHTLELICTSRAYQLPSVGFPDPEETSYTFRGPLVKRMSGEQFLDAISSLTGVWQPVEPAMVQRDGRGQGGQLTDVALVLAERRRDQTPATAHWIWNDAQAAQGTIGGTLFLRREFTLKAAPQTARVIATGDNSFTLYVNGKQIARGDNWQKATVVDLQPHLRAGQNVFAVAAVNSADKDKQPEESSNSAGLLLSADIQMADGENVVIETDDSWLCSTQSPDKWETVEFDAQDWKPAVELADIDGGPWKIRVPLLAALIISDSQVRAAMIMDDALTRALGRSNREQVVTRRQSVATTLQALELTNGGTLDAVLKQGAENWLQQSEANSVAIVDGIYTQALGRAPTLDEAALARALVGEKPSVESVQDLLWVVVMLPEFQLIE